MSIEIVNGYPCTSCTDVENARKGVDPARPDPSEADAAVGAAGSVDSGSGRGPAVTLSGAPAQVDPAARPEPAQPDGPGQQLDLFA
jgi:hypothetical protein